MADITGQAILHVLYEQLMKYEEVTRYEEWFSTALVQDDEGRIAGVVTRNIKDGAMELFAAKAVILATGGNGQIYDPTTNALICTGDGIAMAYRIGAPLMDMEMIQYHPTTLAGLGLLITEGARGEGAHLYNAQGERFMEKYAPNKMELASRDVVSRAEQTEINEGRGFPDGTVALDITVVPRKRIHEALREIVNVGRDFAGVDITREPIHIKPGNHYVMGGVKTDIHGQTPIPGLYAAGECACVSVHGGNRLGANSLLDTLVFGRRSGEHAAEAVQGMGMPEPSRSSLQEEERTIQAIVDRDGTGRRVSELKAELGATMDKYVAVFRDEAGLNTRARDCPPPPGRGSERGHRRQGQRLQPGRARCAGAPVHARQRRGHRGLRARAQGEPRRPHTTRLSRAERRGVAQAHQRRRQRGGAGALLLARDHDPVGAAGEDVLRWPTTR